MVFGNNARHGVILDEKPLYRGSLDQGDRLRFTHETRQGVHDFAPARIPAGVNYSPARMRGLQAKNKSALAIAIKRDATPDQVGDCLWRRGENCTDNRLIAKAIARIERVGEMV